MHKVKAVFFDLDGTLVDSAPDFYAVVNSLRLEEGRDELPHPTIRDQVSNGGIHLSCLTWDITPSHPDIMIYRQRLLDRYTEYLGNYSSLFEGFAPVLSYLEKSNIAWGIVTNKPRPYAVPLLNKLRIDTELLICPEDVVNRKPHPEPLIKAAQFFDVGSKDCIYVGDHVRDIESAIAANMPSVAALFGYIESDVDPKDWGADFYIDTPAELMPLLS